MSANDLRGRLALVPKGVAVYNPDSHKTSSLRTQRVVSITESNDTEIYWDQGSSYRSAPLDAVTLLGEEIHNMRTVRYVRGKTPVRPQRNLYAHIARCSCGFEERRQESAAEARKTLQRHVDQVAAQHLDQG